MDLNKLAIMVAKKEGLKQQVNIAQIKEIMKVLFNILADEDIREVERILRRYR